MLKFLCLFCVYCEPKFHDKDLCVSFFNTDTDCGCILVKSGFSIPRVDFTWDLIIRDVIGCWKKKPELWAQRAKACEGESFRAQSLLTYIYLFFILFFIFFGGEGLKKKICGKNPEKSHPWLYNATMNSNASNICIMVLTKSHFRRKLLELAFFLKKLILGCYVSTCTGRMCTSCLVRHSVMHPTQVQTLYGAVSNH